MTWIMFVTNHDAKRRCMMLPTDRCTVSHNLSEGVVTIEHNEGLYYPDTVEHPIVFGSFDECAQRMNLYAAEKSHSHIFSRP